jgi:hypothetical protein
MIAPESGLITPMRSPFALKTAPVALRSRPFVVVLLFAFAAAPTAGALPREDPEKASPVEVPEIEEPAVWPDAGLREDPVNASPEEVPETELPAVVPGDPVALAAPTVPVDDEVVEVVALGAVPRAADPVWAWAAVPARAIATEVAMNAGVSLRIEVSLDRISELDIPNREDRDAGRTTPQ